MAASKLAGVRGPSAPASKFAAALSGARVFEDVTLPGGSGLRCKMRVLTRTENQTVEIETRAHFAKLGLDLVVSSAAEYNAEFATRCLAIACRDLDDPLLPLATVDEWRDHADDGLIGWAWERYQNLRDLLDPVDSEAQLTELEAADLLDALKKKDVIRLRSFGLAKLCHWLLTTGGQPSTSTTPRSGSGPDSLEAATQA